MAQDVAFVARFFGGVRGSLVGLGIWAPFVGPGPRVDSPDKLRGLPVAPGVSAASLVPEAEEVSDALVAFESADIVVPDVPVGGGVLVDRPEAAVPDRVSAPADVAAAVFALVPVLPVDRVVPVDAVVPAVPVDATFAGIGAVVSVLCAATVVAMVAFAIAAVFSAAGGAVVVAATGVRAAWSPLSGEEMAVSHAVMVCPARWKALQIA